jgi:hypothetical protein
MPDTKDNLNSRLSANQIKKGNLIQDKKVNSIETNKPHQTRFTANTNPLNRKKITSSKEKNVSGNIKNPIKINTKNDPIVNKNTFSENYKSNYTDKAKKENKSKSKSPIPKFKKKNDILDKINNIAFIPLIKNENSVKNFFSNSKENDLFEKDLSETNVDNLFDPKTIKDKKTNNILTSKNKLVSNYKQNSNYKIKNLLNSDTKIQNELDLLTNELDYLIKDAGNIENSKKIKKNIKKTNLDISSLNDNSNNEGVNYWKLNQEYKRNQLKKIENPLDTDFRNLDNENIFADNYNQNTVLKLKRIQDLNGENYEKLTFKRVCLSDFLKSNQGKK